MEDLFLWLFYLKTSASANLEASRSLEEIIGFDIPAQSIFRSLSFHIILLSDGFINKFNVIT